MKKKLEEELFKKYPVLLRGRNKPPKENLLCFGLEIGCGWYDLLDNLLADIKEINNDLDYDIEIVQIKEKYGSLRVYTHGAPNKVFSLINKAEKRSKEICEGCGTEEDVELKAPTGYWQALCPDCWEEYLNEKIGDTKRKNLIKRGDDDD